MEEIFKFLSAIRPITPECIADILRVVKFQKVKKGDIILKIGEINERLYFITKGALHCFYYVDENPVSDWFFFENETVVSIGSFYDQSHSHACIVALEDSELYYITYSDYEYLKSTYPEFCYIASKLLERYLVLFHEHSIFIRKTPALKRYQMILEKRPELVARVPVAALATWLDMEPETLSRMRKKAGSNDKPDE
jgi:CRP/FNR family transcriptional regulator, anaerobic regulatory protein